MTKPAQLRAAAAYFKRREAAGMKRVTVWLAPGVRDVLDKLGAIYGSKDEAVSRALMMLATEEIDDA